MFTFRSSYNILARFGGGEHGYVANIIPKSSILPERTLVCLFNLVRYFFLVVVVVALFGGF